MVLTLFKNVCCWSTSGIQFKKSTGTRFIQVLIQIDDPESNFLLKKPLKQNAGNYHLSNHQVLLRNLFQSTWNFIFY